MRAAQKNMRPAVVKRFYAAASVAPVAGGFSLRLDGRGARTPAGKPLAFPTRALAELVALEWAEQGETIDPASMPMTRIANSAIDGVAAAIEGTRAELAAYAEPTFFAIARTRRKNWSRPKPRPTILCSIGPRRRLARNSGSPRA